MNGRTDSQEDSQGYLLWSLLFVFFQFVLFKLGFRKLSSLDWQEICPLLSSLVSP